MKKLLKFSAVLSALALSPIIVLAATLTPPFNQPVSTSATCSSSLAGISKIICQFQQILNSIVPVLVALGLVYFIWGVIRYVIADGEEDKKKGKEVMIYGVIGFAVIVGLWGLVNIVVATFGIGGVKAPVLDTVATSTTCAMGTDFKGLLNYITCIINSSVIPLIFAIAMVMFVWGVVNFFIINADEEAKRAQGKQFMIWGIVALAVMLSVWGLVGLLGSTFGIKGGSFLPQVTPPGQSSSSNDNGGSGDTDPCAYCGGDTECIRACESE